MLVGELGHVGHDVLGLLALSGCFVRGDVLELQDGLDQVGRAGVLGVGCHHTSLAGRNSNKVTSQIIVRTVLVLDDTVTLQTMASPLLQDHGHVRLGVVLKVKLGTFGVEDRHDGGGGHVGW